MTTTAIVVTGCVIVLGIYDLIAFSIGGVGSTISRFMLRSALRHPVIAFTVGFISGHIFGYMRPEEDETDEPQ